MEGRTISRRALELGRTALRFLLIDGYNLLHAAGLSQARYAPGDLQRQRHRLLVRLADLLTKDERAGCTVVFDAIEAPAGLDRRYRHAEISVLFAERGHDADELIETLIDAHHSPTQLLVVSSDHRLQRAARRRRAMSVDSEPFLQQLAARSMAAASTKPPSGAATKPSTTPPDDDVAYWMGEFGEIDPEALEKADSPDGQPDATDPWQKGINDLQRQLDQGKDLDDWLNRRPDRPGR